MCLFVQPDVCDCCPLVTRSPRLSFVMFCKQQRKQLTSSLFFVFFFNYCLLPFLCLVLCFNTRQGLLAFAVNYKDETQTGVRVEAGGNDLQHIVDFCIQRKPV